MKLLQNLYFRFYQLMDDTGNGDIGTFASTLFMTMIFGVNVFTVMEILDIFGVGVMHISKFMAIAAMVCIFIGLYFLLVYNGRSAKTIERHAGETQKHKLRGRLALIAYILLSIALLVSTWMLMAIKNRS